MEQILITGASGTIGSRLTELLMEKGYNVKHLLRKRTNSKIPSFTWNVSSRSIDPAAFNGTDVVVHLAGAGIADKPWTKSRKQEILESRVHSSRLLFDFLRSNKNTVKTFVSASAIGYYGFDDNNTTFREYDAPGNDFLAEVVKKWEAEVDEIRQLGIRVVKVRVGIVLNVGAGVLHEIAKPIKFYVGAPLGSGEQKVSWIHLDDLCRVFIKCVEDPKMEGAVNGVGPYPVTNRELTKAIAKEMGKPLILPPIPAPLLKLLLGEMSDLALKGSAVSNEKLINSGFNYQFNTLENALHDLLKKK